jgi:hypothetical protein
MTRTVLDVTAAIRAELGRRTYSDIVDHGPVGRETFEVLERTFFDITFDNGRVYRIRVSDITPERVTP